PAGPGSGPGTGPGTGPGAGTAAGLLRAAGWRVLSVRSAAELARAWTTAGKAGEDFVRDGS
ncbi:hypothetical protein HGB48_37100, partial [Actinomadura latina]